MKRCLVTCIVHRGDGISERLQRGAKRLQDSLLQTNNQDKLFVYTSLPQGCPLHNKIPYAFKAHIINDVRLQGYEIVVWLDASVIITGSLQPIWKYLTHEINGVLLSSAVGFNHGMYVSDECLRLCRMNRKTAFQLPQCIGCLQGFNFNKQIAQQFFDEYLYHATDGRAFIGSKHNIPPVSTNPMVKGHRHDQGVITCIAHKYKIKSYADIGDFMRIMRVM